MVADSVLMGLLAAPGFGVAEFASALLARRISHFRLIFGVNVASVLVATAYAPIDGGITHMPVSDWLTTVGLGAMYASTYLLHYAALRTGPVAVVSPIMSVYKSIVILLAVWLLSERMTVGQSIGAAAALLGVFIASTNPAGLRSGRILAGRGVAVAFAAMIAFGVFYYSIASLSRDLGWFLPIYLIRMFTAVWVSPLAIFLTPESGERVTPGLAMAILAIGAIEIGGMFAFARGAEIGIVAIVAAVSAPYTLVPIAGGLAFLRERLHPAQWLGIASVVAGVILISIA